MTQASAKAPTLLDLMSDEDAKRAKQGAEKRESYAELLVTTEWMMLSELGYYFGWAAIQAVIDDTITIPQAQMLVQGAKKLHSADVYDSAIAGLAANSTKKENFKKILKPFISDMKVAN